MNCDWLEERILEHEGLLYRISMSMLKNEADSQDAVQDAILIAFEKIDSLKNREAFASWLCRILIRCCYRTLRERKRFAEPAEGFPEAADRNTPYLRIEIEEMMDSLPPKIRAVFLLHYVEGYSVEEIHSILRIPKGTVKSRLNTGRRLLRENFDTET